MNSIKFFKYQGAGNDFIMVDARDAGMKELFSNSLVTRLCDRHFGIGADGLILLLPSEKNDFHMKYFNSDGNESTMCGNGGRCIASFAKKLGIIKDMGVFSGSDGEHIAYLLEDNQVRLKMVDIEDYEVFTDGWLIDTGVPHFVIFRDELDDVDVNSEGRKYRYESRFEPGGANINFVRKDGPGAISVRTYERGVESETLACGTGSVASAIIAELTVNSGSSDYIVTTLGGKLKVSFKAGGYKRFHEVWLEGPAEFVFEGEWKGQEIKRKA